MSGAYIGFFPLIVDRAQALDCAPPPAAMKGTWGTPRELLDEGVSVLCPMCRLWGEPPRCKACGSKLNEPRDEPVVRSPPPPQAPPGRSRGSPTRDDAIFEAAPAAVNLDVTCRLLRHLCDQVLYDNDGGGGWAGTTLGLAGDPGLDPPGRVAVSMSFLFATGGAMFYSKTPGDGYKYCWRSDGSPRGTEIVLAVAVADLAASIREEAAVTVQSLIRGCWGRRRFRARADQVQRDYEAFVAYEAATRLQATYRGRLAKARVAAARVERDERDRLRMLQMMTGQDPKVQFQQYRQTLLRCKRVLQVATGGGHTLLLTDLGQVMTMGCGENGQLGHGGRQNVYYPKPLEKMQELVTVALSAGALHSILLTKGRDAYTFGHGRWGQLGHGNREDQVGRRTVQSCGLGLAATLLRVAGGR